MLSPRAPPPGSTQGKVEVPGKLSSVRQPCGGHEAMTDDDTSPWLPRPNTARYSRHRRGGCSAPTPALAASGPGRHATKLCGMEKLAVSTDSCTHGLYAVVVALVTEQSRLNSCDVGWGQLSS